MGAWAGGEWLTKVDSGARICAHYMSWKSFFNTNDHNLDLDPEILIVSNFETFDL